jgi:hypothetical protein
MLVMAVVEQVVRLEPRCYLFVIALLPDPCNHTYSMYMFKCAPESRANAQCVMMMGDSEN